MSIYITIDGGTTNTRIYLAENKKVLDKETIDMGARSCIDSKELFLERLKDSIEKLIKNNNLSSSNIECILASGMITSEFGLCSLEHIKTPAGLCELHNSMYKTYIKEISEIPFVFIRGVKTDTEAYESFDMMRGEETELMGIINPDFKDCLYILPGSHSKIVKVDLDGRIVNFSTMLTGEMIKSLSENTILKDAVDLKNSSLDSEYLVKGYDCCKEYGINKSLFKVRILKNIFNNSKDEVYSFFIGAVLQSEIEQIINYDTKTVVIGGKSEIKNAMEQLLKNRSTVEVITLDENTVENSTVLGAIRIFE